MNGPRSSKWARRTTAQGLAQRARIILECAAGHSTVAIAHELRITRQTVGRWRQRFLRKRLDGLMDEPRPGAPRRITDAQVEQVIIDTLEKRPAAATHWSTRTLAHELELSHATVGRIWRAFGRCTCSSREADLHCALTCIRPLSRRRDPHFLDGIETRADDREEPIGGAVRVVLMLMNLSRSCNGGASVKHHELAQVAHLASS